MMRKWALAAVLTLVAGTGTAQAHTWVIPVACGVGPPLTRGLEIFYQKRTGRFALYLGVRSGPAPLPYPGYVWAGRRVVLTDPWLPPVVAVQQPAIPPVAWPVNPLLAAALRPEARLDPVIPAFDPGDPASVFRPIRPQDRARVQKPEPPRREPPPLFRPDIPEAEPVAESRRQIALGRAAFAAQEYGRAAWRFEQAVTAAPQEGLGHFLLGQAHFAAGKYAEAVAAIYAGLAVRPDGPAPDFRPRDTYGANVGDYFQQLRLLEQAAAQHPDDPVLLVLLGWQYWFDGQQEEARRWFRRALPLVPGPVKAVLERFLRDPPEKAVRSR